MSIDHISAVLNLGPEVTGAERMVAIVLAEAANRDTDECWPSADLIRHRAGIRQEKSVKKAIAGLVDKGLVEVSVNAAPDSRLRADRRPNLYRMTGALAMARGGSTRLPVDRPPAARGGSTRQPRGGSTRPNGGVAGGDLTVSEPEQLQPSLANGDAVRRAAERLVVEWWEWRKQRGEPPAQSYIGVLKVVERALRQGVTVQAMAQALRDTPTVTAAALEFALNKARGKVGRQAPDVTPDVAAQIVADYEHANGAGPRTTPGSALPLEP